MIFDNCMRKFFHAEIFVLGMARNCLDLLKIEKTKTADCGDFGGIGE